MDSQICAARKMEDQDENILYPKTRVWLTGLPSSVNLRALAHHFPRIANRIAGLWDKPVQCGRYLDELLFNDRSGLRQGFPPPVCLEIMRLKSYLIDVLKESCAADNAELHFHDIWGGA